MKALFTGIFISLLSTHVNAQSSSKTEPADPDSTEVSIVTIGASYGNTTNYYGQTTAEKLPYGSADISYQSKTGLWAAASAIKLINTGAGISEIDLSAGYDFNITKKLEGSLSYTRYFFEKNSPLLQSINPNSVSGGLLYDWNWLNSSLYGDYLFGLVQKDFFLTLSNSKLINLGSVFSKSDYVTLEPSVHLTAGTLVAYEEQTTEEEKGRGVKDRIKNRFNGLPVPIPGGQPRQTTTYVETTNFNFLTSTFKLPLAYNRTHYTIEAAYQVSLPNNISGIDTKTQSFFTLGLYYLFY